MDTLVTVHSLVRWLVLVALVGGMVIAFAAARRPGEAFAKPIYSAVAIVMDVQVTLGLVLWLFNEGWNEGFFMKVIHPVAMILALGVTHMAIVRGRKTGSSNPPAGNRMVGVGLVVALVLVFAAIPWQRL